MPALLARVVVLLRWPIVIGWVVAVGFAVTGLPTIAQGGGGTGSLGEAVPEDADAVRAEVLEAKAFGVPLASRLLLVRRAPDGLSEDEQRAWVRTAVRFSRDGGDRHLAGALPLVGRRELVPFAREDGTTALAYVVARPDASLTEQTEAARRLAAGPFAAPDGTPALVTGVVPARLATTDAIESRLWIMELATALLVALVVGLHFRAIGPPLLALGLVGTAYVLAIRAVPWVADRAGLSAPQEVEPVITVLVFGAVTDYAIFYLSRCRSALARGVPRVAAAREAATAVSGAVTVAALIVALAAMALGVSSFEFFRAFGPGMAVTVLVGWAVVVTLAPAVLAIGGTKLFHPCIPTEEEAEPGRGRRRVVGAAVRFPIVVGLLVVLVLGAGAAGVSRLVLEEPAVAGLPSGSEERRGQDALAAGIAPGLAAPVTVLLRGPGAGDLDALARLQDALEARSGVTAVLGPADRAFGDTAEALVKRDGSAARLAVVLDGDPLGPDAIGAVRKLDDELPGLVREAGLRDVEPLLGGQAALAAESARTVAFDVLRVGPLVLLVVGLALAAYLRAVLVPFLLLLAGTLGVVAALGLTALLWAEGFGDPGLSYVTPFAAAVLLLALGSDYNVLLVGRIWTAARSGPPEAAIADAAARASRPIGVAAVVLAASFALLAVVPLQDFRQLAAVMAIGLLIDAFLVRTLLVPALVTLAARRGAKPAGMAPEPTAPAAVEAVRAPREA